MQFRTYLEFDLMLERTEMGYRARVLSAPTGTAVGEFGFPFSELELENFVLRMGQKRQSMRGTESSEMLAAKDFGARLYDTVFVGTVRSALDGSFFEAAEQAAGLRIRLRFASSAPELIDLPWEYLFNPDKNRFLSLSVDSPLVRDLDLTGRIEPLRIESPLRVLVMIASPSDYEELDVEKEWSRLKDAVADLEAAGRIVLERTDTASLSALQRQLRKEDYHIFHFIGHGGFDAQANDGVLVFVDESGRGRKISGQQLGTILHDEKTLRLAILNACEGGRASFTDPFAGVAQSLLQQDIPAVIAMQFEVSDRAAITLAHEFYAAIADGYPVDAALSEARKSIYADVSDVEWGTPVLYMRVADGRIFDVIQSESPSRPPVAPPTVAPPPIASAGLPPTVPSVQPAVPAPSPESPAAVPQPAGQDVRRILTIAGIAVAAVVVVIAAFFILNRWFNPSTPTAPVVTPATVDPGVNTGSISTANTTTPTVTAPAANVGVTPTSVSQPTGASVSNAAFVQQLKNASNSFRSIPVAGCSLPSRLWIGALAYVSDDAANTVRGSASRTGTEIGSLEPWSAMRVTDGPVCAGGWVYWKVESKERGDKDLPSLVGWTAEGNASTHWIKPLTHPLAYLPGDPTVCPGLYPSHIRKGDTVLTTFEPPARNRVRAQADRDAGINYWIDPGEVVKVVGGPTCAQRWIWWEVENAAGAKGWTSEGDADIHWLLPINDLTTSQLRPGNQGVFVALPQPNVQLDAQFADWTGDWQDLTVWSYPTPAAFGDPDNLSAQAQIGWSADGLLVAVQVTDDRYSFTPGSTLTELFRQDSLEILLDRSLADDQTTTLWDADDYQIIVGFGSQADKPVAYQFNDRASPNGEVAVEGAARLTADGYAAEFLLPWRGFGLNGLAAAEAAQPFGFTLSLNDRDTTSSLERIVSSSPTRRIQNNPTLWGTLILAESSAPSAGNFTYRGGACQASVALPLEGGMERICVAFDYSNIPAKSTVVRDWNYLGEDGNSSSRWVRYECAWDQPESGQFQMEIRDTDVGLRSGIWQMTVAVEGKEILSEEITIPGNADGWDPVTSVQKKCK